MNKKWDYLVPGDIVDIIAPASHSPDKQCLEKGSEWLRALGLVPRAPQNLIRPDAFFAAPLELQFEHFKSALYSDSKAIWCLRGGYGSMRLIPMLEKLRPPKKPKMLIGFSDITSLHLYLNQKWNWPTIHGRTISQLAPEFASSPDRKLLKKLIFGQISELVYRNLRPMNDTARDLDEINGKVIGGNFRLLQSSIGTAWELNAKGKIVFIEDVSERGYSLDRMFEQLIQAKILSKGPKALVLGDFTGGDEKDGKNLTSVALKRFADRVDYPVFKGLKSGHGAKYNYPVLLNSEAELKNNTLRFKLS